MGFLFTSLEEWDCHHSKYMWSSCFNVKFSQMLASKATATDLVYGSLKSTSLVHYQKPLQKPRSPMEKVQAAEKSQQ